MFVVYNNGLNLISESLSLLHMMHHEATACHVTAELTDLLTIYKDLIQALKQVTVVSLNQGARQELN